MSFTFARQTVRRRPSLTPMIDVVFLLLVFFMLAARFGQEAEIALAPAGSGVADTAWSGPPRLVRIAPDQLWLNGQAVALAALSERIAPLMTEGTDPVILLPEQGADLQRLLDVMATLHSAGLDNLILAEAP